MRRQIGGRPPQAAGMQRVCACGVGYLPVCRVEQGAARQQALAVDARDPELRQSMACHRAVAERKLVVEQVVSLALELVGGVRSGPALITQAEIELHRD